MKPCCNHTKQSKKCKRKKDEKVFTLPRKFTKKQCKNQKGFSMRSSCAPYRDCFTKKSNIKKKQFLFNPKNPSKSFDVYIDKNPKDTIPIKYTTIQDVKQTIRKLEKLFKEKKYSHKRIWQVGMILYVRLKVLQSKKKTHFQLAKKYHKFLSKRSTIKNKDKTKQFNLRKKLTFVI